MPGVLPVRLQDFLHGGQPELRKQSKMIHRYTLFGYNIVLDVESGTIHLMSDVASQMAGYLETELEKNKQRELPGECPVDLRYSLAKYEGSEVKKAYSELLELYESRCIFSSQEEDLALEYSKETPVKALCLNVAHECNMECAYCFAGGGSFGSENGEDKLMSEKTAMAAMRFLMENSKNRRNLEVDFFGGEPLLNFETVKNTVSNTRALEKKYNKNVRFTLTTNGTLLDAEKIDFINENISNVVLSLDGTKETNDKMRKYANGGGSYADIVPLYQKLVAKRKNPNYRDYYIRGTFTKKNLNFAEDALHMRELGFENISIEPVVAEESSGYAINARDLPAVFGEYEILAKEMIRRGRKRAETFNFFHFNIDLENGPCAKKRAKGCGSGSEYAAVTPNGGIYPCHQFAGNEKYRLGNVNTPDISLNRDLMGRFYENNIVSNEKCQKCWAKYFCGGGCPANNENFSGSIYEPYEIACEMEKKRVECAIAIKAVLSGI